MTRFGVKSKLVILGEDITTTSVDSPQLENVGFQANPPQATFELVGIYSERDDGDIVSQNFCKTNNGYVTQAADTHEIVKFR